MTAMVHLVCVAGLGTIDRYCIGIAGQLVLDSSSDIGLGFYDYYWLSGSATGRRRSRSAKRNVMVMHPVCRSNVNSGISRAATSARLP